jgi:hypothetical protein
LWSCDFWVALPQRRLGGIGRGGGGGGARIHVGVEKTYYTTSYPSAPSPTHANGSADSSSASSRTIGVILAMGMGATSLHQPGRRGLGGNAQTLVS